MVIQPRVRGFICTTAHPDGCAANVSDAIEYVNAQQSVDGSQHALVVGCSTGYGLASRIVAAFGSGADTIGVALDREPTDRGPGTAGWYNNVAFDRQAREKGLEANSINGDAFSHEIKEQVIELAKRSTKPIDLVVYSLASPVRVHPDTGERYRSSIKPIGESFVSRTLTPDINTGGKLTEVELEPATAEETEATIKVMGGEDWEIWIERLVSAGVLAPNFRTIAFTYLGNELTQPIYRAGTLGKAKEDLDRAAKQITQSYQAQGAKADVAVLKAVVTQASTAIPVVPLYFSILFSVMKEQGTHENCIEHIFRLFSDQLYCTGDRREDEDGRIRMDDWELDDSVQEEVRRRWQDINEENLAELADVNGFTHDFLRLFGFDRQDVDYDAETDHMVGLNPE